MSQREQREAGQQAAQTPSLGPSVSLGAERTQHAVGQIRLHTPANVQPPEPEPVAKYTNQSFQPPLSLLGAEHPLREVGRLELLGGEGGDGQAHHLCAQAQRHQEVVEHHTLAVCRHVHLSAIWREPAGVRDPAVSSPAAAAGVNAVKAAAGERATTNSGSLVKPTATAHIELDELRVVEGRFLEGQQRVFSHVVALHLGRPRAAVPAKWRTAKCAVHILQVHEDRGCRACRGATRGALWTRPSRGACKQTRGRGGLAGACDTVVASWHPIATLQGLQIEQPSTMSHPMSSVLPPGTQRVRCRLPRLLAGCGRWDTCTDEEQEQRVRSG